MICNFKGKELFVAFLVATSEQHHNVIFSVSTNLGLREMQTISIRNFAVKSNINE